MFIKRLELIGFKSFAEKTKLDFEAGVTAVVGPNGCGKSNIADALKWVLGEQSVRSMRGAKMEDVVFHGAEGISAVGFAEVSLTISNQDKLLPVDYEEVAITRRIFRSGESEYLLNRVPVRLKDILELLMGTGMGIHSYSIMEQGKVDRILSSRPEDRRQIFEEASGITKYKVKKEEALRKLERTQENLQRIGDIIVEVKRQIKAIERQVNRANKYKQEFEKLKEYELNVAQYQFQDLKKERKEMQSKIGEQERQELRLAGEIDSLAEGLTEKKQTLASIEEGIAQFQGQRYEVSTTIKTAQNKISLNQERIEELINRQKYISTQIESLETKISALGKQGEEVQQQMEAIKQSKEENSSSLELKQAEINNIISLLKQIEQKIAEDKMKEVELLTQQTRFKNNLTRLETDLANSSARQRRLNLEYQQTEEELKNVEVKLQTHNDEFTVLNDQLQQSTKEIWDLKSNLEIRQQKKQTLLTQIDAIARKLAVLQSKLGFLQEMTKKHEGFSRGVKAILSAIASAELKLSGFFGVVANLIEVLPQYQVAIEAALGENVQSVLVENWQVACAAIDFLREKDLGRVNFICLDSLKDDNQIKLAAEAQNAAFTEASQLVKTEPRYQKAVRYLLSNIFIAEDTQSAREFIQHSMSMAKLVTMQGEILTNSSVTAGSVTRNLDTALLGRQERIANCQADLETLGRERANLEDLKMAHESEIEEITNLLQQREPDLNQSKIKLANKESQKNVIENEKKRFSDEISVLQVERDETDEQIEQLKQDQERVQKQLLELTEKQNGLEQLIQSDQTLISEQNQSKEDLLVEIAQAQTRLSASDRELENANTRLSMLQESASEQRSSQQARADELQEAQLKVEQLKQESSQLEYQTKEHSQRRLTVEEKLQDVQQQRQVLSQTINSLEGKSRADQKVLDQLRAKKANLQVEFTGLNYKQDTLKQRMQQGYQVDLEGFLTETSEVSPPQDFVFAEIERLKAKLEGLGSINLVAIEENEQLQQRYSFLVSQQRDLTNAQDSLRQAIVQVNRRARTMFSETFEKVQLSFREYFRVLFGGGEARLILVDENNILESGIEIVVRPPGKRLQNISLLSGGEKALTAIALLFAVFKVKPSPFCILDEVDAPLDEANVDRFTDLLREFIKTSQFIIITHNKKTINMADVMYGITMAKSGISKIVSVKFSEGQQSATEEMAAVG